MNSFAAKNVKRNGRQQQQCRYANFGFAIYRVYIK